MVMIPQKFQHKLLSLKLTILAETYNNMDPNEIESKGNDYSYSTIYGELQDVGSDFIDNDIDQYDHFVQNTNDKRNSFKSRRLAADNTLGHLIKQCNANKIGLNFDLLPYQTAIQMRVADETNQLIGMIEWNAWYKLFEVHHVKNNKFATTFVEKEKFLNYLLHWKTRFLNSIDQ